MDRSQIYMLIAIFLVLSVILVWLGMKFLLDTRKRRKAQEMRRKEWRDKLHKDWQLDFAIQSSAVQFAE